MRQKNLTQIDYVTGLIGAMMLIVYWLIVATLPDFFFVNPAGDDNQLRRAELILSTIGWIMSSTVAPIALFLYSSGFHSAQDTSLLRTHLADQFDNFAVHRLYN